MNRLVLWLWYLLHLVVALGLIAMYTEVTVGV